MRGERVRGREELLFPVRSSYKRCHSFTNGGILQPLGLPPAFQSLPSLSLSVYLYIYLFLSVCSYSLHYSVFTFI